MSPKNGTYFANVVDDCFIRVSDQFLLCASVDTSQL